MSHPDFQPLKNKQKSQYNTSKQNNPYLKFYNETKMKPDTGETKEDTKGK